VRSIYIQSLTKQHSNTTYLNITLTKFNHANTLDGKELQLDVWKFRRSSRIIHAAYTTDLRGQRRGADHRGGTTAPIPGGKMCSYCHILGQSKQYVTSVSKVSLSSDGQTSNFHYR